MNKKRRAQISKIISTLDDLREQIDGMAGDEQDAYDNMPESFQNGEKGDKTQEAADRLNDATTALDDALSNLNDAIGES